MTEKTALAAKLAGVVAAAFSAASALAAVTITKVSDANFEFDILPYQGCSGITYAGGSSGNDYYVVQDHANGKAMLYPVTINVDRSTGIPFPGGIQFGPGMELLNTGDAEGVAFDPCSLGVWISDEGTSPRIREFMPFAGSKTLSARQSAPVPDIFSKCRANLQLEALTISGDGKTMWTANEEALIVDGGQSSDTCPAVVRLARFTRTDVHDKWKADGQWAYKCEPPYDSWDREQCGLSGLCALPDGSLLVLEREVSTPSWGRCQIYRVAASAFTAATDITNVERLLDVTPQFVAKGSYLFHYRAGNRTLDFLTDRILCYEGICLGPRLDNGDLSVLLVSDGQTSSGATTVSRIMALRLSGLGEVDTVDIPAPEKGTASLEGRNYRFMRGTQVTSEISGLPEPVETAYTNRGAVAETGHASWTATGSSGGSGSTMTFTVSGDVQATWTVVTEVETNTTSQLLANDSFEGCPAGTGVASLAGWTNVDEEGTGVVVAETYMPPDVGFPLGREAHTKVLALEDADVKRTYDVDADSRATLDMMVSVVRCARMPAVDEVRDQTAVAVDADGHLCLSHRDRSGGVVWTPISDETFENGDWVRFSVVIDYASDDHAYVCPRINGALTTKGVAAPSSSATQGGPWYRAVLDAGKDGKGRISSLSLAGNCKVDDIVVGASGWKQEGVEDDEPSIPSEQGTMEVKGDVATVTPAPGVKRIDISNGEGLSKVVLPPSVETVVGVPPARIVIRASTGHDITGAFKFTGDVNGVTISLDEDGEVTIDGETITVRPQLSSVAGSQESPFEVGGGRVSIGIRSIPDLVYRLKRGADVTVRTTGEPVGESQTADKTRLILSDDATLPAKAFYLISVSR